MDIIRAWWPEHVPEGQVACLINVYDKTGTVIVESIDATGMVLHPGKTGMDTPIPAPKHPKGAAA